jgi:hypothetical protein
MLTSGSVRKLERLGWVNARPLLRNVCTRKTYTSPCTMEVHNALVGGVNGCVLAWP